MKGMAAPLDPAPGGAMRRGRGTAPVLLVPAICLASQLRQVGRQGPGAA